MLLLHEGRDERQMQHDCGEVSCCISPWATPQNCWGNIALPLAICKFIALKNIWSYIYGFVQLLCKNYTNYVTLISIFVAWTRLFHHFLPGPPAPPPILPQVRLVLSWPRLLLELKRSRLWGRPSVESMAPKLPLSLSLNSMFKLSLSLPSPPIHYCCRRKLVTSAQWWLRWVL